MTSLSDVALRRDRRTTRVSFRRYRLKTFGRSSLRGATLAVTSYVSLAEGTQWLAPSAQPILVAHRTTAIVLGLGLAVAYGVLAQWKLARLTLSPESQHSLTIVVEDFIKNLAEYSEASCAFGVNDRFSVTGLKEGSAHQDFLRAYFGDNSEETNQALLDKALVTAGLVAEPTAITGPAWEAGDHSHERERHPLGTVACLPFGEEGARGRRHAFLLANSSAGTHGFHGSGSSGNLVSEIWSYHARHHVVSKQLLVTLIGNGHSNDLDPMSSARNLIDCYYRHLEQSSVHEVSVKNLLISISPETVNSASVDLELIHAYARTRNALYRALL